MWPSHLGPTISITPTGSCPGIIGSGTPNSPFHVNIRHRRQSHDRVEGPESPGIADKAGNAVRMYDPETGVPWVFTEILWQSWIEISM